MNFLIKFLLIEFALVAGYAALVATAESASERLMRRLDRWDIRRQQQKEKQRIKKGRE